jgi:hypothetical protein
MSEFEDRLNRKTDRALYGRQGRGDAKNMGAMRDVARKGRAMQRKHMRNIRRAGRRP